MGVIVHVGRKTQRQYRTPVMVFRGDNRLIIALTYGRKSEWVQNVLTRNGCDLETRKRKLRLFEPRVFHDQQRRKLPAFVGFFLGLLNASDFLELAVAEK
jgi:deazaflavin-dependent oxidoreductase (nitroreductase family)